VRQINESCADGAIILVEGMSDREALVRRGVRGRIVTLHEFLKIMEDSHGLRVIALLDLDRHGESTFRWLERRVAAPIELDNSLRTRLRRTKKYWRGLRTVHQIFMGP